MASESQVCRHLLLFSVLFFLMFTFFYSLFLHRTKDPNPRKSETCRAADRRGVSEGGETSQERRNVDTRKERKGTEGMKKKFKKN